MDIKYINNNFTTIINKIKTETSHINHKELAKLLSDYNKLKSQYNDEYQKINNSNINKINSYKKELDHLKDIINNYEKENNRIWKKIRILRETIYTKTEHIPLNNEETTNSLSNIWFLPSYTPYLTNYNHSNQFDKIIIKKIHKKFKNTQDNNFIHYSSINILKEQEILYKETTRKQLEEELENMIDKEKERHLSEFKNDIKELIINIENDKKNLFLLRQTRLSIFKDKFTNSYASSIQLEKINKLDNETTLKSLRKLFIDNSDIVDLIIKINNNLKKLNMINDKINLLQGEVDDINQKINNELEKLENIEEEQDKEWDIINYYPIIIKNNTRYNKWIKLMNYKFINDLLKNEEFLDEEILNMKNKINELEINIKHINIELEEPLANIQIKNLYEYYTKQIQNKEKQIVRLYYSN